MDTRQRRVPPSRPFNPHKGPERQSPYKRKKEPTTWGSTILRLVLTLIISSILLLLYALFLAPSPMKSYPAAFRLPQPPQFEGKFQPNDALTKAQRIHEGKVRGPESIFIDQGVIYTGTTDGKVVVIEKGELRTLTTFGKPPCESAANEPTCGRPLGMRMGPDGFLVVIDAYLGLYKVNVATGDHSQLFPQSMEIAGHAPLFLNDLDITREGIMYMTDSCKHWQRRHYMYCLLQGQADGRLIRYDPNTNSTEVVLNGLFFANGVQLSRKQDYLLVAETGMARIWKYHLSGSKSGQAEIFADNLPGLPDNIRKCSKGGYWVGMATCRYGDNFSVYDFTANKPWLRRLAATVLSPAVMLMTSKPCGIVVHLDTEGRIVRTLQDPTGKVINGVSEVEDKDGVLYLGSYKAPYIGKYFDN